MLRVGNLIKDCCRFNLSPALQGCAQAGLGSSLPSDGASSKAAFQGQGWLCPAKSPESVVVEMLNGAKRSHQSVGDEMCASADTYAEMQKSFVHIMEADKYAEMCIYTSRSPPQCKMLTLE